MRLPIEVKNLRVRSLDRDYFEVSWEIAETAQDVFDYTFQVLRSESPSGPFDVLCDPFQDRFLFVDNLIVTGDRWRFLHYMIRVVRLSTGDTADYGPITHEPEPDLIALELRRHMQLLFHEFTGRRCWILPARTFGQRCSCWDRSLFKRTRSRCMECFDTGFTRGYMSPIEAWIQFEPSPKATQTTNVGAMQQVNTTARLGYYPPLRPMDLIIEPENRRWKVTAVSGTEQVRAPVHQEIQVHEVPMKDIEFEVPLRMEDALRDIWFSPPRNFSNPQNLQNTDQDAVPDIFSVYNMRRPLWDFERTSRTRSATASGSGP